MSTQAQLDLAIDPAAPVVTLTDTDVGVVARIEWTDLRGTGDPAGPTLMLSRVVDLIREHCPTAEVWWESGGHYIAVRQAAGRDVVLYPGETLPEPVVVALSTSEYVEIAPENAAFIATARDAMPRLLAFAEAVLALHRPVPVYPLLDSPGSPPDTDAEPMAVLCSGCTPDEVLRDVEDCEWTEDAPGVDWPCPTAALAERLGGEGL